MMKIYWHYVLGAIALTFAVQAFPDIEAPNFDTSNIYRTTDPDFLLSINPVLKLVSPGLSATYDFDITPVNDFKNPVHFSVSGLPSGSSASFKRRSGRAGTVMTVTTRDNVENGTYILTVLGKSGSLERTQAVALCVASQTDFSIEATPKTQTIAIGESAIYMITVHGKDGVNSLVDLSVSGLPIGGQGTFTRTPCTSTSILTVTTGRTPAGDSTLTITGKSGSFTHSTDVNLSITQGTAEGFANK